MNAEGEEKKQGFGGFRICLILSFIVTAWIALLIYRSPLIDSDTYEFGTVARSLWLHGTFTETAIRAYSGPDVLLKLPHPADHRANLTAVLLAPFYGIFKETQATVAVPYLIMFFLAPLILFFIFRKWFGSRAAVLGVVYYQFLPRMWFYSVEQDMGNADIYNAVAVIASLYFYSRRKYKLSGLMGALAIGFKSTAGLLFPAYFGYWLLFDRSKTLLKNTVVLAAIMAIPMVLTAIRSTLVFGDPFFNEEIHYNQYTLSGKPDEFWMGGMLCDPQSPTGRKFMPMDDQTFLQNQIMKIKAMFIGKRVEFGKFPGVFDSIGYYLFPFLIIGTWIRRRDPLWRLLVLLALGYIAAIGLFFCQVEDRHYWVLWMMLPPMAFKSVEYLPRRFKNLDKPLLALCLAPAAIVNLAYSIQVYYNNELRSDYLEYLDVNRWIYEHSQPGEVVMSAPYWSPAFFHRRCNVPFPLDTMAGIENEIARYHVGILLLDREMFVKPVPLSENMRLELKGKRFEVVRVLDSGRSSIAYSREPLTDYTPSYEL